MLLLPYLIVQPHDTNDKMLPSCFVSAPLSRKEAPNKHHNSGWGLKGPPLHFFFSAKTQDFSNFVAESR
jgi:hypothetical protein